MTLWVGYLLVGALVISYPIATSEVTREGIRDGIEKVGALWCAVMLVVIALFWPALVLYWIGSRR